LPLQNAIEIFEGDEHGCALKGDGTVWCWALTTNGNGAGQLGSGSVGGSPVLRRATQVRRGPADAGSPALTGAIHINSGSSRSYIASTTCAILQDTSLWCWGAVGNGGGGNFFNDGVAGSRPYAVPILASATTPLTGVSQVGLGRRHACALRSGEVWCWGSNVYGALGIGNEGGQAYPTRVTLPGLAQQIGVGSDSSCALVSGAVYCWGLNNQGQLGVGTPVVETGCSSACSLSPKQVLDAARSDASPPSPLSAAVDLNVAYHAACARRTDHSLFCWGAGTTDYASPLIVDAAPLTNVLLHTSVGSGNITGALRWLTRDNVLKRNGATFNQVCP
jgi:alpha-tubulin suppressor-like RCC1 family protein